MVEMVSGIWKKLAFVAVAIVVGIVVSVATSMGTGAWLAALILLVGIWVSTTLSVKDQGIKAILQANLGPTLLFLLGAFAAWKLMVGFIGSPQLFVQQVINGFKLGFIYALIALGYTMVYGIVRLINFAHGDIFMVGAFTSYYAIARFSWHFVPAVFLSVVVCVLLAVVIERVAYKPLRNAPRIAALITAIGMSFFLEYFSALDFAFTSDFIVYKPPAIEPVPYKIAGIRFSNIMIIVIGVSILCLVLLQFIVHYTKLGKAMRAVSYDKPTARLMGINVDMIITMTFAIGSAMAGIGGVLYAATFPQINYLLGIMPGLKAFVAAVLGGIGSIPGALVGSLIMGQAEMLSAAYISSTMRDAIAFTLLIIVLLIRPTGIFGEPTGEKA